MEGPARPGPASSVRSPMGLTLPHRSRPIFVFPALAAILACAIDCGPPSGNPAVVPEPRPDEWLDRHRAFVEIARRGDVDVLFLGDSITDYWRSTAPDLWDRYYAPRKAANFGIGADHTQHVLWRLDHGELDGIRPRVVVVMIGTNNLAYQPEDEVVEGVKAVLERVRARLPASEVLLLGLTPRGLRMDPGQATAEADPRVPPVNQRLAKLRDGRAIRFLDIGPKLLDDKGRVVQAIEPDLLHLSHEGYRIWAEAMEPMLDKMLRD